jgi:hypothetical protein
MGINAIPQPFVQRNTQDSSPYLRKEGLGMTAALFWIAFRGIDAP